MWLIVQILLLTSIGYFTTEVYLPSLPHIQEYFNTDNAQVQYSISVFLLGFGIVPLIVGPISDRVGRKPLIIVGLLIGILSTIWISASQSILGFITGRLFQGIGFGMVTVLGRVLIPDCYQGKKLGQITSINSMLIPIMLGFAPLMGGLIEESYSWRMIFRITSVYGLLLLGLVIIKLPETLDRARPKIHENFLKIYGYLLTHRSFMLFLICSVIPFVIVLSWITVSPFILQNELGYSPSETGFIFLLSIVIETIGGLTNLFLIRYISHYRILQLSGIVFLVNMVTMALCYYWFGFNAYIVFIPGACTYFIISIIFPNAYHLGLLQIKTHFGSAAGLLTAAQLLISTAATALLGFLTENSLWPLISVLSVVSIIYMITLINLKYTPEVRLE